MLMLAYYNHYGYSYNRRKVKRWLYRYDLLVTAIKANQHCRNERQNLSILRSTPVGKHIEPEIAKEAAISLIDCFHRLYIKSNSVSSILLSLNAENPLLNALKKGDIANSKYLLIFNQNDP
jgi:hypothetical protein